MFYAIGLLFIIIYGLIVYYIGRSGWSWVSPALTGRSRRLFLISYAVILLFLATSFILARMIEGSALLHMIGSYWLAIFSLLVMLLPVVHLLVWLSKLTKLPRHQVKKWSGILTLTVLVSLIGYGSFNAYSPVVRSYDVTLHKKGPDNGKLNIVMASDMHFSYLSGKRHALRMVEEINALKPDIVLFPGDIIDDDIAPYVNKGIGDILADIEATYGVYASLGNHDRFKGEMEELIALLEQSNMKVLYDESITIDEWLTLIGRKDRIDEGREELASLMEDVDHTHSIIVLDHQPYALGTAQELGVDLMVSGHTHRGQIAPAHLITQRLFENDWGHLQKGEFHSIVSSGYGFWGPPIRIGSRAEIVQIEVNFE